MLPRVWGQLQERLETTQSQITNIWLRMRTNADILTYVCFWLQRINSTLFQVNMWENPESTLKHLKKMWSLFKQSGFLYVEQIWLLMHEGFHGPWYHLVVTWSRSASIRHRIPKSKHLTNSVKAGKKSRKPRLVDIGFCCKQKKWEILGYEFKKSQINIKRTI